MDLITDLYTQSCFDSRLTFGDDCPKIIETFGQMCLRTLLH